MEITNIAGTAVLANGVEMPYLGLGTYQLTNGRIASKAVEFAIQTGYRHFDTATLYANEQVVAKAIRESSIAREDIFVTTKVWNSDQGYHSTIKAIERSLNLMKFDYIDLYLIHWPVSDKFIETWKAMEEIYHRKLARAIGVSNFLVHHLEHLMKVCRIKPMVNQVEFHPYLLQRSLHKFCMDNEIQFEAWSPLMRGSIVENDVIRNMAERYTKQPAQIVLRWDLQKGVVTIPKSENPERIASNARLFDFSLSDEDMSLLDSLNRSYHSGVDPALF